MSDPSPGTGLRVLPALTESSPGSPGVQEAYIVCSWTPQPWGRGGKSAAHHGSLRIGHFLSGEDTANLDQVGM